MCFKRLKTYYLKKPITHRLLYNQKIHNLHVTAFGIPISSMRFMINANTEVITPSQK